MFYEIVTPAGSLRRTSTMYHEPLYHEQRFCVMGETLLIQTNHPALLELGTEAFGRYGLPETVAGSIAQPLVLRAVVQKDARVNAVQHSTSDHPKTTVRTNGHLLYLGVGAENSLVVDLRTGFAYLHLSEALLSDRSFVRYTFLEAAAQAMLGMARGYVAIHAACVVKDGISVMLKAEAGTGKSTLAFACLYRGYQVLAEDVVQLKVLAHGVELWGMPWKFHLLRDSVRFFPPLHHMQPQMQVNGEWKIEVDLDHLFPDATVTRADPGLLVLLERKEGKMPEPVQRLAPEAARGAVDVIWSWQEGWGQRHEEQLQAHLLHNVYRLPMNGSPFEAVDILDALVADYRAGK